MRAEHVKRRAGGLALALSMSWWVAGCAGVVPQPAVPATPQAKVIAAESAAALVESLITSPIGTLAEPSQPWQLTLLPRQTKPATQFSVVDLDGQRVLRVAATRSYGKLLHPVKANGKARPR